jgi:hypothetical protein
MAADAAWYGLSFNAAPTAAGFFHLELLGGEWEGDRPAWSMRAWLGNSKRRIRATTLGGQRGVLYDHPDHQGVFDDHLTFIWKKGKITYAASLHARLPRGETTRALGTIIAALRPTAVGG